MLIMENTILSERLKQLRLEYKLKQNQLGQMLTSKRTASTISLWETPGSKRTPDYEDLIELANIFNCTIDYLVGNSDNRYNNLTSDIQTENLDNVWPEGKKILLRAAKVLTAKEKERVLKIINIHLEEEKKHEQGESEEPDDA
jgi:transcriptional regulator with XRE-family HTH domain